MSALAVLRRLDADPLRRYAEGIPGWGGMSLPQQEFHRHAPYSKRASVSANGIGKSYMGAAETWWHLLGRHPFKPEQRPVRAGWVLTPNIQQGWGNISRVLHELEPPGVLDPACHYRDGLGYVYGSRHMLKVHPDLGGGFLVGKGCVGSPLSLESEKIDFLWVDEPPTPEHFSAARARVTRTGGPLWVTLTPINRPVEWLREMLEGDKEADRPPEPGWWMGRYGLSRTNAPHLSPEKIAEMIQGYLEHERPQRVDAAWEGYTRSRWVSAYRESRHCFSDSSTIPTEMEFSSGWDHGERPGSEVAYLIGWDGHRAWVLGEYVSADMSQPAEHAQGFRRVVERYGLSLFDVTSARGDINSAGWLGPGRTVNQVLEEAFALEVGMPAPPFRIEAATKGTGSVRGRAEMLNAAFNAGRLFIHESCAHLRRSLAHWQGADDDLKHAIDAVGYGLHPLIGGSRSTTATISTKFRL